ncbi:MAG: GGDEF domain-containing protein [Desulfobacteraceae bacterium]|nr:GGDEF domain-containing protein [Desulfobacteraceae bacterium]
MMSEVDNIVETMCPLDELPALPSVATKILEKIREPDASMHQLAGILATDPPLSVKVLSVVNSSFFGLPKKITNLPHAVNLLGEDSLKYIALSFSLIHLFDRKENLLDYSLFWKSSLTSAVVSRILCTELDWTDCEDMYFLGLVHNIGILMLAQSHPRQYALVMDKVGEQNAEFYAAENEVFGCNHMQVGAMLAKQWGLPESFSLRIANHHHPDRISDTNSPDRSRTEVLRLAFEISRFLNGNNKTFRLSRIEEFIKQYEIDDRVDLESVIEKVSAQIEPLLPLFNLESSTNIDCLKLLEDSKREMFDLSFRLSRKVREQQESIENLSMQATRDSLTGLWNYRGFQEALDSEIASVERHNHTSVLALVDLDAFKTVNDMYGHLAGDHVLKTVSDYFRDNIRKSDLVARYGGEEFVFILRVTEAENGFKRLDRLREKLAGLEVEYHGEKISVTMSVGLTLIGPGNPATGRELIRRADNAMYHAKKAGRNRTVRA